MSSQTHEAIADLVRDRPSIVLPLLERAGVAVGAGANVELLGRSFAGYAPEYTADAAVALRDAGGAMRLVVIVEVQLRKDKRKWGSWPVYEALARARHGVDACVLVVTTERRVAKWARRMVALGPSGSRFVPIVVGPAGIPLVVDESRARENPELAVLSAVAHGNEAHGGLDAAEVAVRALHGLHEERAKLYLDLVHAALNAATRTALEALMDLKNYQYKSDFARRYVAQGRTEAMAEAVLDLAAARGLIVTDAQRETVLACRDLDVLRAWHRRALAATSMDDVLSNR